VLEIPSTDSHHDVEYTRDEEEVGREDELVVEKVSDDPKDQGESEWDEPERNRVSRCEEQLESLEIVFETFLLQTKGDLKSSFNKENTDTADTPNLISLYV
jgi:hypothetical protein